MNQKRINHLLLALAKEAQHGRELARKSDESQASVARALHALEERQVIKSETRGKNKVYRLTESDTARHLVAAAEHQRTATFLQEHPREAALFAEIQKRTSAALIILFGSYAKGGERKESDYDLYMDISREERDALHQLHRKLRIQAGRFDTGTALTQEIIKNHIILKGVDGFLALTHPQSERQAQSRRPFGGGQ